MLCLWFRSQERQRSSRKFRVSDLNPGKWFSHALNSEWYLIFKMFKIKDGFWRTTDWFASYIYVLWKLQSWLHNYGDGYSYLFFMSNRTPFDHYSHSSIVLPECLLNSDLEIYSSQFENYINWTQECSDIFVPMCLYEKMRLWNDSEFPLIRDSVLDWSVRGRGAGPALIIVIIIRPMCCLLEFPKRP